ncbi:MAG: hypothetical protein MHMPM18_001925 [Marteilia pararefringens]
MCQPVWPRNPEKPVESTISSFLAPMCGSLKVKGCCNALRVLQVMEIISCVSTLLLVASAVLIGVDYCINKGPTTIPECDKGEQIFGCICTKSIIGAIYEYCRDLDKERACLEESGIYSYYSRDCIKCPPNQIYNRRKLSCEDCSGDLVPYFNQCVTPMERCNYQSMRYVGSQCVTCASGSQLSGNECVANSKPGDKKTSRVPTIVAVAIAIAAVLILLAIIVGIVAVRRQRQRHYLEMRDTECGTDLGKGMVDNIYLEKYTFDETNAFS